MENRKHYAAAITAFVIWGFFSIPLRALKDYGAGEILYFRILFSFVTLALLLLIIKRKNLINSFQGIKALPLGERKRVFWLTLAGGSLLCVNWLTFIYIVNHINIKTASFSYLICPVITAVLGYVIIRERLTLLQWVSVGLCAASCVLIGFNSVLELGYSFLTAFTYALYLITQRKNQHLDRLVGLGIQILVSFIILNLCFPFLVGKVPDAPSFYLITILIAIVFTVLPLFLNLYALNRINSATIGILMYINPIFNFSLAFILFKEGITAIQLIGYSIILIALVIFNYSNLKKIRRPFKKQKALDLA